MVTPHDDSAERNGGKEGVTGRALNCSVTRDEGRKICDIEIVSAKEGQVGAGLL